MWVWSYRGLALEILGRVEDAEISYQKAIGFEPKKIGRDDSLTWQAQGVALAGLKRYEEAIASYDKAVEIEPDKANTWNNQG